MKISDVVQKLKVLSESEGDCDVTVRLPVKPQQVRTIQNVEMGGMHD